MIPTVVIVNDNNSKLLEYENLFSKMVRVYVRTSLEGERLYSSGSPFFEGVMYFNERGEKVVVRRDEYKNLVRDIMTQLNGINLETRSILKSYLQDMKPLNLKRHNTDILGLSPEEIKLVELYISQMYES